MEGSLNPEIEQFLDRNKIIAVVGASSDPEKWGNKLYRFFKSYYRRAYPVNPHATEIDGDKAYPNLSSLPEMPDVVDLVVKPSVAREVVDEVISLGVKLVWFQPGSEDEEAIEKCLKAKLSAVWGRCLMETIRRLGNL